MRRQAENMNLLLLVRSSEKKKVKDLNSHPYVISIALLFRSDPSIYPTICMPRNTHKESYFTLSLSFTIPFSHPLLSTSLLSI
jgi:hypothetical protein